VAVLTYSTLALRPSGSEDAALLRQIFLESHCAGWELLPLDEAAYQQLVEMQSAARQSQYRTAFPGTFEQIIEANGVPVGSCWISESADELRVVDLAVLTAHRRQGVATAVLRRLGAQAAAENKPVRLSVWQDNLAAQELYRSLGFRPVPAGQERMVATAGYSELEWSVGMHSVAMQAVADD